MTEPLKKTRRRRVGNRAFDAHVGQRVRLRRTLLGMSQERLGDALELTFQQVQKYERGANRVSASMMVRAARCLEVAPAYFFEGVDALPSDGGPVSPFLAMAADRAGLELAEAWPSIPSDKRRVLVDLAKSLQTKPPVG